MAIEFDDERWLRTLRRAGRDPKQRPGVEVLAQRFVRLRRRRPGAANTRRKVMALLFAMVLCADSVDDCDVLRAGARAGCWAAGCQPHRR